METYAFWRDREARFKELSTLNGAFDLHAIRSEVDLPALLGESSERTRAAITNPLATPESVYRHARAVARAGRILLDGEQGDKWRVSGGPSSELAREALQMNFKAEAMIAAAGAGEADTAATDQAVLEAWLDFLWTKLPHHRFANFGVEHLAHASAEMCNQFAALAYRAETGRAMVGSRQETAKPPSRFPNRGAWLDREIAARDLTPNRLKVLGGLDPRTTLRIRQGERVGPQVLRKLAKALSISPDQIPND